APPRRRAAHPPRRRALAPLPGRDRAPPPPRPRRPRPARLPARALQGGDRRRKLSLPGERELDGGGPGRQGRGAEELRARRRHGRRGAPRRGAGGLRAGVAGIRVRDVQAQGRVPGPPSERAAVRTIATWSEVQPSDLERRTAARERSRRRGYFCSAAFFRSPAVTWTSLLDWM